MGKYLKYIALIGLGITAAGLVIGVNSPSWIPLPLGLVGGGIFLILFSLLGMSGKFWQQRSTQVGTNALIATLSTILILGLINFLALRIEIKLDLTENKLFSLSPQSQEVLKTLQNPVKVWIFNNVPDPISTQINQELLENYSRYSSNFEFEFVNPEIKLGVAQEFNLTSPKAIYLESEEQKKLVESVNFPEQPLILSESALTNAIVQLKRDSTPIYLLQGHDELSLNPGAESLSKAALRLSQIGYQVIPLNLTETLEIPSDAGTIIVPGPKRTLLEAEVQALQTYLKEGGSVLLMIDPGTDPGLDSLLEDWGVQLDERLIINASEVLRSDNPATAIVIQYGDHPITAELDNNPISIYPWSRAVDALEVEGIEASVLFSTSAESWAEQDIETDLLTFDPERDRLGPLNIGIAFSRPVETAAIEKAEVDSEKSEELKDAEESSDTELEIDQNAEESEEVEESDSESDETSQDSESEEEQSEDSEEVEHSDSESEEISEDLESTEEESSESKSKKTPQSRLVVFGNSTFATDGYFDPYINGDIFLNAVEWLSQDENPILSIRPKEANNRRINLSDRQSLMLNITALAIIPLIGFLGAGIIWFRRR